MRSFIAAIAVIVLSTAACAEVIDRIVAYVDDYAITERELLEEHGQALAINPARKQSDTLESMINRYLLVREAGKMRLEAMSDEELVSTFIDIKIRSSIIVRDNDINKYYRQHRKELKGALDDNRERIRQRLFESESTSRLARLMREIKSRSEIVVLLDKGSQPAGTSK